MTEFRQVIPRSASDGLLRLDIPRENPSNLSLPDRLKSGRSLLGGHFA